jgi:hypothetical protein
MVSLLFTIAFTGSAFACNFDSFTPNADCNGWSVSGSVYIGPNTAYVDLIYDVTLSDGSGTVATFNGSEMIYSASPTFSYGSAWGMELCGDYTATGTFHISDPGGEDTETFSISFRCICDEPNGCTGTPGYWRNHPDDWPVSGLTIGGVPYTKAQLMIILDLPVRGDASIKLFHHLVAAKLNVLHGAGSSIQGIIDAADAFLAAHPLYSRPTGALKTECNGYKNALVAYNESDPCGQPTIQGVSRALTTTPAPKAEATTWGVIKQMYK